MSCCYEQVSISRVIRLYVIQTLYLSVHTGGFLSVQVFMFVAIGFCIVQLLWYSLLCHSFPPKVIIFVF